MSGAGDRPRVARTSSLSGLSSSRGCPLLAWGAGGLRGNEHLIVGVALLDNAGGVLVAEVPVTERPGGRPANMGYQRIVTFPHWDGI